MLKRVLIYTLSLLVAPMFLMPFEPRTPAFAAAAIPCSGVLFLGSHYVVRAYAPLRWSSFIGNRLLIAAYMTRIFAVGIAIFAVIFLASRNSEL